MDKLDFLNIKNMLSVQKIIWKNLQKFLLKKKLILLTNRSYNNSLNKFNTFRYFKFYNLWHIKSILFRLKHAKKLFELKFIPTELNFY